MIEPGRHAVIVGQNGSGKSQMLIHLALENSQKRIILDTKKDDDFLHLAKGKQVTVTANNYREFLKHLKKPLFDYLIVRPEKFELADPRALDNYLSVIAELKNYSTFIDEAYPFHSNGGRCYQGMTAILTRGRSAGLSLITCTQRPAWVSNFIYSESSIFFIFRLIQEKDRKKIAEFIPYNREMPERYYFYYHDINGENRSDLCEPIKVFKRPITKKKNVINLF